MTELELIEEYRLSINSDTKNIKVIPSKFKPWAERRLKKRMLKPLFISVGKGGGQKYKILYEVFDSTGNNNKQCYFYSEVPFAIKKLSSENHYSLQEWINDPNKDLIIK